MAIDVPAIFLPALDGNRVQTCPGMMQTCVAPGHTFPTACIGACTPRLSILVASHFAGLRCLVNSFRAQLEQIPSYQRRKDARLELDRCL